AETRCCGRGAHEAVSTPMRIGAPRFMANAIPRSRQTSSAQSITVDPQRPLSRFFALTVQQHCIWRDSSRIAASEALPPPWCGLDIGVVILLEAAAIGDQGRR